MAQQHPSITFEDISLQEARRIARGPRMDPELYETIKINIGRLSNGVYGAVRMVIPPEENITTMKNRILCVASELNVPVTIRRIPGGLLFWHSTDEDHTQAQELRQRLQLPRPSSRPGRRRGA